MCQCKEEIVEDTLKHYSQNQTILNVPDYITLKMNEPNRAIRKTVTIDNCLVDEIKLLWSIGVETSGCCCGHNRVGLESGQILVGDGYLHLMQKLGYAPWKNPYKGIESSDGFIPLGADNLVISIMENHLGVTNKDPKEGE